MNPKFYQRYHGPLVLFIWSEPLLRRGVNACKDYLKGMPTTGSLLCHAMLKIEDNNEYLQSINTS